MSCVIYWFSGTGNSRAVAASISARIGESELVWMGSVEEGDVCSGQSVGFVFPVHCFSLPNIVRRVARALTIAPDAYVFSVATMAGVPGACHHQLSRTLEQNAATLSAGWSLPMPLNYTPLGGPPNEEKRNKLIDKAEKRAAEIAEAVKSRDLHHLEDSFTPARWGLDAVSRLVENRLPHCDRKFFALEECSSCGTCERVCPVGNIELEDGHPVWKGQCEQCFACLHWCPVEAVQWGHTTIGRERYHHPAFRAEQFFLRPGTEAATGETDIPECTSPDGPAA